MESPKPFLAGRSSRGLILKEGIPELLDYDRLQKNVTGPVKSLAFNKSGDYIAYNDGTVVRVYNLLENRLLCEVNNSRIVGLSFSPLGSIFTLWEPHKAKTEINDPGFNLHIYETKTGNYLKGLHQKRQTNWQLQWTDDETLAARMVNNEVQFYANNLFETIAKKIYLQKVADFCLASGIAPFHVTCFVHGTSSGQPSSIKLYCYRDLETIIASKSLFKADKIDIKWNKIGSACVALASVDSDKSGASYYGEQTLHFLSTKGESCHVQLGKNGPIYSVEWNPNSNEFCVVYGFMPAKATLFNLKTEIVFDFGTGPRNSIYYNTFGNILILSGFGNINGSLEVWDLKLKKQIIKTVAHDTTYLEWCANGENFLTATLSPRLRVGNGYKVWHYTGKVIYEFNCEKNEELWEVIWRPFNRGVFKEKQLVYNSSQTAAAEKPPEVYRPPAARGIAGFSNVKIHDDFEKPSNLKESNDNASKSALKNRKKREAKKTKKDTVSLTEDVKSQQADRNLSVGVTSSNPETDKKIKNITKKLEQIKLLKEQQASGKQLEKNQIEKIQSENDLIEELRKL